MSKTRIGTTRMGRISVGTVLFWLVGTPIVLIVIAGIVTPFLPYHGCPSQKASCQSNIRQMGKAFKMYLGDWNNTYPTNRPVLASGRVGPISCYVKLTPVGELTNGKKPHNLSWVEALYPYMEMPSVGSNGAWECRSAGTQCYPQGSMTAYTTYVMNRNLVEQPEQIIRAGDCLMLAREADRHLNAELRPANNSCDNPSARPDSPFLTGQDSRLGRTNRSLHADGSQILFADSHVRWYHAEYLPEQTNITKAQSWDANKRQWFNYSASPTRSVPTQYRETIAITP